MSTTAPQNPQQPWQPLGDSALRRPRPPGLDVATLLARLRAHPGVLDAVVAAQDVAIYFDPQRPPVALEALATALEQPAGPAPPGRRHEIAVVYDGEDLAAVAAACGLSVEAVIALHSGQDYRVEMLGFLPGFAYLGALPEALRLPRRAQPRPRIPASALAIGGPYTAIYPCASPGGWHLLGHAPRAELLPAGGARLQPGDRVRFLPQ